LRWKDEVNGAPAHDHATSIIHSRQYSGGNKQKSGDLTCAAPDHAPRIEPL